MFRDLFEVIRQAGLSHVGDTSGDGNHDYVLRVLSGPFLFKTMYILRDYSGAIDAWLCDNTMAAGSYCHYRLVGIQHPDDWWRCTTMQLLGLVRGDPELAARSCM